MELESTIEVCSFASGSSGNCYLVKNNDTALLIDVGISGKKIIEGIESLGISQDKVKGILITHGHSDHIKSLHTITKKIKDVDVFATKGTWDSLEKPMEENRKNFLEQNAKFQIGDIEIKAFPLSHDIEEAVGYSFYQKGKQISIVTDTGCIDDEIFEEIKEADVLIIEANHEVEILEVSNYPYFIKRRILSDKGHLSNAACGECLSRIVQSRKKPRKILLAHLSKENNTPHHARLTVLNSLEEAGCTACEETKIEVLLRNELSDLY